METGWIKLHRKITDWEWFTDHNVFHVFMYILLNANHEEKKWRGVIIKKGQLLTSIETLSLKTKLSNAQIRLAIKKLKTTNEIAVKTTNLNTLISIVNWEKYQVNDEQNSKQIANKEQTTSQTDSKRIATTKNDKNEKNVGDGEPFFEFFRRVASPHITDDDLMHEIQKFKNKYPNAHPNRSGGLINTWVSKIGQPNLQVVQETKPKIVV
jgi:hypothetical protein